MSGNACCCCWELGVTWFFPLSQILVPPLTVFRHKHIQNQLCPWQAVLVPAAALTRATSHGLLFCHICPCLSTLMENASSWPGFYCWAAGVEWSVCPCLTVPFISILNFSTWIWLWEGELSLSLLERLHLLSVCHIAV